MSAEFLEVRPLTLVAATPVRILVVANFFQLMQASSDVTIEFFHNGTLIGTATDVPEGFRRGPVKDGREWDQIRITSAIGQTIQYCLAFGEASLQRIVGSITATLSKATTAADTADQNIANGATVVIPANANRRALTIYAKDTNTANLRTGPAAAAGRGRPLVPGMQNIHNTTAAIKVHNDTGAAQDFGYDEETD